VREVKIDVTDFLSEEGAVERQWCLGFAQQECQCLSDPDETDSADSARQEEKQV
jgi:hypothetical protein